MGVALRLAIVAISGGAGCAMRVMTRDALARRGAHPWWSTCAVNLAGAFAAGLATGAAAASTPAIGALAVTAATGALAGWTTYSAFAMDVVQLWLRGARREAAVLWAFTLAGAPLAAAVGHSLISGAARPA
jgi:CrcB protein